MADKKQAPDAQPDQTTVLAGLEELVAEQQTQLEAQTQRIEQLEADLKASRAEVATLTERLDTAAPAAPLAPAKKAAPVLPEFEYIGQRFKFRVPSFRADFGQGYRPYRAADLSQELRERLVEGDAWGIIEKIGAVE